MERIGKGSLANHNARVPEASTTEAHLQTYLAALSPVSGHRHLGGLRGLLRCHQVLLAVLLGGGGLHRRLVKTVLALADASALSRRLLEPLDAIVGGWLFGQKAQQATQGIWATI